MKKIFLPVFALAVVLAGCTKNEFDATSDGTDVPEYIHASIPTDAKVHLEGLKTSWHTSDRISLFAKSDAMHFYAFKELTEGDNVAAFKYHSEGTDATTALDKNYCIYPDRGVTDGVSDNTANADGILTTRIVNGQKYNASNLLDYAPMVAVSDGYEFEFRNVASVIRFNVKKAADFTDECTLKSIRLESSSQFLSGMLSVDTKAEVMTAIPYSPANMNVNITDINKTITAEAQSFCVAVFPAVFPENDLKIIFIYDDESRKTVQYPKALTLRPGTVQDIDCTIKKPETVEDVSGVDVITGGIYEFNGHPHLTCYTASVTGGVTMTDATRTVTELGVLFKRNGMEEDLVIGNVDPANGTNNVRQVKASSVSDNVVLKLNNLVGGSDGATRYAYRFYAVLDDGSVAYGQTKEFRTDTYTFVPVKAGTFTMGADSGQSGYYASGKTAPAHQVTLTKDFEISKYELSVPEFVEFLNSGYFTVSVATNTASLLEAKISDKVIYKGQKTNKGEVIRLKYENDSWSVSLYKKYPIDRVSKYGAEKYCEWLTETKNDGYTYRLPTEAEWEWAAMGGETISEYEFAGSNTLADVAVFKPSGLDTGTTSAQTETAVLGTKYPNELGIYDMSGNLWEIVADKCDKNWLYNGVEASYFEYCKDGVTDPIGPFADDEYSFSGNYVCLRKGGSVNDASASKANFSPHYRRDAGSETGTVETYGFRIVRVKN